METGRMLQAGVQRPSWTSTISTGMFGAFNHLHGIDVRRHYYKKSRGFEKISDYSRIFPVKSAKT